MKIFLFAGFLLFLGACAQGGKKIADLLRPEAERAVATAAASVNVTATPSGIANVGQCREKFGLPIAGKTLGLEILNQRCVTAERAREMFLLGAITLEEYRLLVLGVIPERLRAGVM